MADSFPSDHYLSLPRPDILIGPPLGVADTTTLAAPDFDVDNRTGFMPPHAPLDHLPEEWNTWEELLAEAVERKLQLGDKRELSTVDKSSSDSWRTRVRELPLLNVTNLYKSEVSLRRAHHVLAWVLHFYVHTLPPGASVRIPTPLSIPLLQVCKQLQLPPVLTYSDNVLYNWALRVPSSAPVPAFDNLRCQTLFTGTADEEEFYLCSARIELRGVEALKIMQAIMDEAFVGDDIAISRITVFLCRIEAVIQELKGLLLSVRENCDPDVFYTEIRPWFRGVDSTHGHQNWIFEGLDDHPELTKPTELSGPSAGQSSLIHALDVFLGVDRYSHSPSQTGSSSIDKPAFLTRMQSYMPRYHRAFLSHLSSNPRPLREFVSSANDAKLLDAYNAAVLSLKEFRDAHMIVVALYIVGPARRFAQPCPAEEPQAGGAPLKGTGGTDLVKFLKGVRNQTAGAIMSLPTGETK